MSKISFIGLGVMGFPMAGYISKAGHDVTVYNRTKTKADKWVKKYKGKLADTPMEAAKDSDFIFTCVGNDNDLDQILIPYDCEASIAHVNMLNKMDYLNNDESQKLIDELNFISKESKKDFCSRKSAGHVKPRRARCSQ